jgi:hypothetical protein
MMADLLAAVADMKAADEHLRAVQCEYRPIKVKYDNARDNRHRAEGRVNAMKVAIRLFDERVAATEGAADGE